MVAHDEDHLRRAFLQYIEKPREALGVELLQLGIETELDVVDEIARVDDPVGSQASEKTSQVTVAAARRVGEMHDEPLPGRSFGGNPEKPFDERHALIVALLFPVDRKAGKSISEKSASCAIFERGFFFSVM